jgi:hypothetical protein
LIVVRHRPARSNSRIEKTAPNALDADAKVAMVNGIFLLRCDWEKVAGQTWSTRPYCLPGGGLSDTQHVEKYSNFDLARLSL